MSRPQLRQPAQFGFGPDDFRKQIERAIGGRVESGGALTLAATPVTASTTLGLTEFFIPVDASGGAVTLTLPPVAVSKGRVLVAKKTDATANAMTLDGNASETIDGATTKSTTTQYATFMLFCDGVEWWLVL